MPQLSRRVLDRQTLTTDATMDASEAPDVGAYTILEIVATVHEAASGESPRLLVRHAPVNEADAWLAFETPMEVDLSVTGATWRHVTAFTRFLGWSTSGTLNTDAVVTLDVVAKG